jgi:hypothetical protein
MGRGPDLSVFGDVVHAGVRAQVVEALYRYLGGETLQLLAMGVCKEMQHARKPVASSCTGKKRLPRIVARDEARSGRPVPRSSGPGAVRVEAERISLPA